jgi:tetratricopeptide (TPR) repeat protein
MIFLAYQGKARALDAMDRRSEAADLLDGAIARARKEQNLHALTQLLIVKGTIAASHNPSETPQFLEEAVEVSEAKGFQHHFAWSAYELAKAYRSIGDLDRAETQASKAIGVMRAIGDRYHLPHHLTLLAGLEAAKGNFERADELLPFDLGNRNGLWGRSCIGSYWGQCWPGRKTRLAWLSSPTENSTSCRLTR